MPASRAGNGQTPLGTASRRALPCG
jgi:hypothetical protein